MNWINKTQLIICLGVICLFLNLAFILFTGCTSNGERNSEIDTQKSLVNSQSIKIPEEFRDAIDLKSVRTRFIVFDGNCSSSISKILEFVRSRNKEDIPNIFVSHSGKDLVEYYLEISDLELSSSDTLLADDNGAFLNANEFLAGSDFEIIVVDGSGAIVDIY